MRALPIDMMRVLHFLPAYMPQLRILYVFSHCSCLCTQVLTTEQNARFELASWPYKSNVLAMCSALVEQVLPKALCKCHSLVHHHAAA